MSIVLKFNYKNTGSKQSYKDQDVAEIRSSAVEVKKPSIKIFLSKSWKLLGLDYVGQSDLPKLRSIYYQFLPTPIPSSCSSYSLQKSGNLTLSGILAETEIKRVKEQNFLPKTVFEGATKVVLFCRTGRNRTPFCH